MWKNIRVHAYIKKKTITHTVIANIRYKRNVGTTFFWGKGWWRFLSQGMNIIARELNVLYI